MIRRQKCKISVTCGPQSREKTHIKVLIGMSEKKTPLIIPTHGLEFQTILIHLTHCTDIDLIPLARDSGENCNYTLELYQKRRSF